MNVCRSKKDSLLACKEGSHSIELSHLVIKLCLLIVASALLCPCARAQGTGNEWAWMGGPNTGFEPPVTGTLGTPAAGNIPNSRYRATTWTDKQGNFWLFGGYNLQLVTGQLLNSLWEFNPSTKEWAWMSGNTSGNQSGVYGTLGLASAQNTPGMRDEASSWTDSQGKLWLFGGLGPDATGMMSSLNDLWSFDPSTREWTWMSGSSVVGNTCLYSFENPPLCAVPAVYGTPGTPAPGNTPGSREGAMTWTDAKGNLWMFGGWSYDIPNQTQYYWDELWEYSTQSNEWALMGGNSTRSGSSCLLNVNLVFTVCGEPGVYGTLGKPAPGNIPGGRASSTTWTDGQGNLWLFSGSGFDGNGNFGDPNDLWKFTPANNQWTWMGGNNINQPCTSYNCSGPVVYGTLGTPAAGNIPPGRDHAVGWTDSKGNLWLFGGGSSATVDSDLNYQLDDLWELNTSSNEWAMMGGSLDSVCGNACAETATAVYGALGVAAPGDSPGPRFAPSGWADASGNFWLFGGQAAQGNSSFQFDSDLWQYQPSSGPLPTTATPAVSLASGSFTSPQSVTLSDSTDGALIYYSLDGTTPSPNSPTSQRFYPSVSQPISIQYSETLKAMAVADGCYPSETAVATYTLPPEVATPTFNLPPGTYTSFQTLTISDTTPGATIYYSTDGNYPTTSSTVYTGPIPITVGLWIFAVATANGHSISRVASAQYTLNLPQAAAPTFNPSDQNGTYTTPQVVTISDATPGAVIRYTTNGYPVSNSPIYTGPITVSSSETIWVQATAQNYFPSTVNGATFNIDPQAKVVATPTFNPPGGTYAAPQNVVLSDATTGATIFYTTDGSTPTVSSAIFNGVVSIASTETLKAIATAYGALNSAIASATYTMSQGPADFSVAANPGSLSVIAGQSGTATISIAPMNGFDAAVLFSCSGLPNGASCIFSPQPITPSSGPVSTAVTVSTSATTALLRHRPGNFFPGSVALAALIISFCKRRRLTSLFAVYCLAGLFLMSGCGGAGASSSSSSSSTPQSVNSTITIVASSGLLQHTTSLLLTVN